MTVLYTRWRYDEFLLKIMKKIVKLCLHSSKVMQISLQFDAIFHKKTQQTNSKLRIITPSAWKSAKNSRFYDWIAQLVWFWLGIGLWNKRSTV